MCVFRLSFDMFICRVHLEDNLIDQGWCQLIPSLLTLPEHDSREKIITSMTTLKDSCRSGFVNSIEKLSQLRTEYLPLSGEEMRENSADMYFTDILMMVDSLIKFLSVKDEL